MSKSNKDKTIEVMIPTTDNWYGNYENNTVKLVFYGNSICDNYRVAVWGNDAFGLYYDTKDKGTARVLFIKLKNKEYITQRELYDLGFVNN